jgi:hypothetical protein
MTTPPTQNLQFYQTHYNSQTDKTRYLLINTTLSTLS